MPGPDRTTRVVALGAQAAHSPAFRIRAVMPGRALAPDIRIEPLPLFTAQQARAFAGGSVPTRMRVSAAAHTRLRSRLRQLGPEDGTVLVQRQVDILPTLSLERRALDQRRLVLDIDDAIWHDGPDAGGHPLARLKGSRRKVSWLAERAEVVIAGNDLLADYLERHAKNVRVIPSLVDTDTIPMRTHEDTGTTVLGWIGSATTAPMLTGLAPAIERFARQAGTRRVALLVVGGDAPRIPNVEVRAIPWSEDTEREALATMDIGLMPLVDNPFTRGKCAYKALQYMAAGIPVVTDDVGISAEVVGDGKAGLVAGRAYDWPGSLAALTSDAALRSQLGREGRHRVERDFSYARWLPELRTVLEGS